MKKLIVILIVLCATRIVNAQINITEYCGSDDEIFTASRCTCFPSMLIGKETHDDMKIVSVINGTYYDKNFHPEGVVYEREMNPSFYAFGTGEVRGYLFITDHSVYAGTSYKNNADDIKFMIGTHPLLVVDDHLSKQAFEARYAGGKSYRSAIGTKDGKHICFVVSNKQMTMSEWALELHEDGYTQAINLDGGPISQLAVKDQPLAGGGAQNQSATPLVFYFYK